MHQPIVRIHRLRPDAAVPAYQTEHAAGMDLSACMDGPVTLDPGRIAVIPCGFAMSLPPGWEGQVRPRSGLASRHGVTLPNAPGTIDADYRGEVKVPLINLGPAAFTITPGMRIAQMVVAPVARAAIVETDDLDSGADRARIDVRSTGSGTFTPTGRVRGAGGFGSTGL